MYHGVIVHTEHRGIVISTATEEYFCLRQTDPIYKLGARSTCYLASHATTKTTEHF